MNIEIIRRSQDDTHFVCDFGPLGDQLEDNVLIQVYVVAMCAKGTQRICAFARRLLKDGTGWVTRDGMFVLNGRHRRIVYELFPAVWDSNVNAHIYIGVKRSDDRV